MVCRVQGKQHPEAVTRAPSPDRECGAKERIGPVVQAGRIWRVKIIVLLLGSVLMAAGCGSPELASRTPTPESSDPATGGTPNAAQVTTTTQDRPCQTGSLRVGDLPEMDEEWRDGIARAEEKARAWQVDAVLTSLRIACELFEPTFRWQATYYSANAQAFFSSDTGEVTPSGVEQENVPLLPAENLSFGVLHRALIKSGFDDATVISASTGVDVRVNTAMSPFGPPAAPKDVILYHVAIERLGAERDLFVDGRDGLVHLYSD